MEAKDKLSEEFAYFKANLSKLYAQYPNKFLIIRDKQVQDFADTFPEAYELATSKFELGTFIIQECTETEEGFTKRFYSRVAFV